ncbi:MAG TPA: tetratricopeptide repeat protein, partial [bacterium]|nr:tetratricopeptide repeat protein [bacterium]
MKRGALLGLGMILLVGVGLRAAYLAELRHAPDFAEPLADAAFHDYWARGWATGDWAPPGNEPDPGLREVPFLRPPGYPFVLSLVYRAAGAENALAPRLLQMLLGVLNALLAYRLGRALLGVPGGLVLAAFAATSWTAIYFEGELQAPVLFQTGAWAALLLLQSSHRRRSAPLALAAGIALGLTALVRANAVAFAPVAAAWLLVAGRALPSKRSAVRAVAVIVGAGLAVAPVTWRNWSVSGELVPISVNGAVNLYIGNHEGADGVSASIPDLARLTGHAGWSWFRYGHLIEGLSEQVGRELSHGDASREFTRRAWSWIRSHPADFLGLTARRAALFWGPREISNNKAIALEKENSRVLAPLPAFPWVLGLSLLGGFLVIRGARATRRAGSARAPEGPPPDPAGLALVALFVATLFLSYVPFLAAARFRAPLVPFVFVFGAWGLVWMGRRVRAREWTPAIGSAAVVVALALLMGRASAVSEVDRAWWHTDRGVVLQRQGRADEARAEFRAALADNPGYVDAHLQLGTSLHEAGDVDGALEHYLAVLRHRPDRTDISMKAAVLLIERRQYEQAAGMLEQTVRVVPASPDAHFELGRALVELGRHEEGVAALDRALELQPGSAPALTNRGIALARLGRPDEAIRDLTAAVEENPFYAEAFFHLGDVYHRQGRRAEAWDAYDQARRIGLAYVEPRVHLGNLHNEAGEWTEAIQWYED